MINIICFLMLVLINQIMVFIFKGECFTKRRLDVYANVFYNVLTSNYTVISLQMSFLEFTPESRSKSMPRFPSSVISQKMSSCILLRLLDFYAFPGLRLLSEACENFSLRCLALFNCELICYFVLSIFLYFLFNDRVVFCMNNQWMMVLAVTYTVKVESFLRWLWLEMSWFLRWYWLFPFMDVYKRWWNV